MGLTRRRKEILKRTFSAFMAVCIMFSTFSSSISAYAESVDNSPIKILNDEVVVDTGDAVQTEEGHNHTTDNEAGTEEGSLSGEDSNATVTTEDTEKSENPHDENCTDENCTEEQSKDSAGEENNEELADEKESDEEDFVVLGVIAPEKDIISADPGEEVTLTSKLNRDDVKVSYQWQKINEKSSDTVSPQALYDYSDGIPTGYSFVLEDMTEAEYLKKNPDATWPGVEMYLAIVDALEAIGEETKDVSIAWNTKNFALEGYNISAAKSGDKVEIYADKDEERYVGKSNKEGKWEFGDAEAYSATWQDIEGATKDEYTFKVTESDYNAYYRCVIKILDEDYKAKCLAFLEEQGSAPTEEEQEAIQQIYSPSMKIEGITVGQGEQAVATFSLDKRAMVGSPALSDDVQWITGLTPSYEYITKETYDRVTKWLEEGKITQTQADRYWTRITQNGFGGAAKANVLDENGFPVGGEDNTRLYNGFDLTDGMLEINSEWYGKTVYFRVHDSGQKWSKKGTAIDVPAYTELKKDENGDYIESVSGNRYKKAITVLNPFVIDTGSKYKEYLEIGAITTTASHSEGKGWLLDENGKVTDNHVTVYAVSCESFNSNPEQYIVDAEGNYRVDSVAWGVCTYEEPDLSGKAYWALKNYIANGYGFLVGHDTMYAYAGAYYDAFGVDLDESSIDPNDGTTWYYDINSWMPGTTASTYERDEEGNIVSVKATSTTRGGHFYLNELVGSNAGNVDSDTVDPSDAPSKILSTGGSNGAYGKKIMYGSDELRIVQTGFTASQALNNPKYRTPTNYPFKFSIGETFKASETHTNQQAAFGTVWANYSGGNTVGQKFGAYQDEKIFEIDNATGTNNFYLSGEGNFLMNQIGHLPSNSATIGEAKLFANSVFYTSQRKQCEICASGQNGCEEVHFVHRINSANADRILGILADGGNYWYSLDDCYMLTDDITLPENWKAIKGFSGHWNSDVYDVKLSSKGTPLLDNIESPAGKYNKTKPTEENPDGWNLGDDRTVGTENVIKTDGSGIHTTGVARVVGDLNDLFDTDTSYAGYTVKILGSDNPKYLSEDEVYNCIVNSDSKYVISNLPAIYDKSGHTGVLKARVYDTNGNEVTKYGIIKTNVDKDFWDNDMTTPLYLSELSALPVPDQVTYEGQGAAFTEASVLWNEKVSDIQWQVRKGSGKWIDIEDVAELSGHYTVGNPEFHNNGEESYTTTSLKIKDSSLKWTNWNFRAVFTVNGKSVDTYSVGKTGNYGKLTVKPWPFKIIQAADKEVWMGEDATFTTTAEYLHGVDDGLEVEWEYRESYGSNVEWKSVSEEGIFESGGSPANKSVTASNSVYSKIAEKYGFDAQTVYKTTSTITIKNAALSFDGYQFRAHYSYTSPSGETYDWYSDVANNVKYKWDSNVSEFEDTTGAAEDGRAGVLKVKPAEIEIDLQKAADEEGSKDHQDDITPDAYGQKAFINDGENYSSDKVTYTAVIYYRPDSSIMKVTPGWHYKTYLDNAAKPWTDAVAKKIDSRLKVTVTNTNLTLKEGDKYYKEEYNGWSAIKSVMTIQNIPESMYDSESMMKYFFQCTATGEVETSNGNIEEFAQSRYGGLVLDYNIALNHMGVNTYQSKNIINGTEVTDMKGMADATKGKTYSVWKYPNLRLVEPKKVNTVNVKFNSTGYDSRDTITYDTALATEYGITVSGSKTNRIFKAATKNAITTEQWQKFLRAVTFTTYDPINITKTGAEGGVEVLWYADEGLWTSDDPNSSSEFTDDVVYNSENGHFYSIITSDTKLTYQEAAEEAKNKGGKFGVKSYLANINNDKENIFISDMIHNDGAQKAWIGNDHSAKTELWNYGKHLGYNGYLPTWFDYSKLSVSFDYSAYDKILIEYRAYGAVSAWNGAETYYMVVNTDDFTEKNVIFDYANYQHISRTVQLTSTGVTFGPAKYGTVTYPDSTYTMATRYVAIPQRIFGVDDNTFSLDSTGTHEVIENVYNEKTLANMASSNIPVSSSPSFPWQTLPDSGEYTDEYGTNYVYTYIVEYEQDPILAGKTRYITDTDNIGTQAEIPPEPITVKVSDRAKIYDGKELMPEIEVTSTQSISNIKQLVKATYSSKTESAEYTETTLSAAATSGSKVINAGKYTVKLALTQQAIDAGYGLSPESDTYGELTVYKRPINLYSTDNNKIYDGTSDATIKNIAIEAATTNSGVVTGDTVKLNTTTVKGNYLDDDSEKTVHTGSWNIKRIEKVSLAVNPYSNYYIDKEVYTGKITARPLHVHSLYQDTDKANNPRNVKTYDGTTDAVVKDILIDNIVEGDDVWVNAKSYAGKYEDKNAGETLTADGKAQTDRLNKLKENKIVLTADISLINNDFGDYYIASQEYSGAISRETLTAQVKNWRGVYGTGMKEKPWHDTVAYKAGVSATKGTWLSVSGLVKGDEITLDYNKSKFAVKDVADSDMIVTESTPVGNYTLTYNGLTETNYPVLQNYIVDMNDGTLAVAPREIVIQVNDTDKTEGEENPPFYSTFYLRAADDELVEIGSDETKAYKDMKLAVDKDNVENSILVKVQDDKTETISMKSGVSNIGYITICTKDSPVLYLDESDATTYPCDFCGELHNSASGTEHQKIGGYEVKINTVPELGSVLEVAYVTNPLGEDVQNYTLSFVSGSLMVHPEVNIQLEATVPLYVCMYGYNGDGQVIEPTEYGITNYSGKDIRITDIDVSKDGWIIKPDKGNLKAGEMYMKMHDTELKIGHNEPKNPAKWIIGEGDTDTHKGTFLNLPLNCQIAGGNVNNSEETFISRITFTIAANR